MLLLVFEFLLIVIGLLLRFFFWLMVFLFIKGWLFLGCEVCDCVWVWEGIVKLWNLYLLFWVFVLKLGFLVFKKVSVCDVGL